MTKICHMTSVHGQEDTRIFHKECVSLSDAGYEVYLISQGETYDKYGVHIVGVKPLNNRLKRMLRTTDMIYRKALEVNAEIYHAHDPELLPVCSKLKRLGKKVIFDSHEHVVSSIVEKEYLPYIARRIVQIGYRQYQKYVCKKLDAIVTATPNVSEFFRTEGCENVIDLCNFPILNKQYTKPSYCSKTLVYAGGIDRQWNHEHIIKVLDKIPGVRYKLCDKGKSDASYLAELKKLDNWNKVDLMGPFSYEKVRSILSDSAVGLALLKPGANTDWENGNMANTKIFEEMMAGLPIICTNFKTWSEFVEKYHCGICVNPKDEQKIAEAINFLFDTPNEAELMGKNGRKAIEEQFNWDIEKTKLLNIYRKLSGGIK